jgi:hypothetical protein
MLVEYKGGNGGQGFDVDVDVTNLPSRREAVGELSRPAAGLHARAKRVPPEMIAQALNNEPFEDYPRAYACRRVCDQGGEARNRFNQSYRQAAEGFLRRTFHSLTYIPEISFDIERVSEENEQKALHAVKLSFQYKVGMDRQVSSLEEAYRGIRALRTVFGNTGQAGSFNMETVVPSRYLPELLMAAPVWFISTNRPRVPLLDVRYFCDLVASDRFAYLFQLYNYKPRSFREFGGRDIMPVPIMHLVEKIKEFFDYLVIATPYHDMASEEWRIWERSSARAVGGRWIRNIDPFLFGFLKQIPELMFFIGRWSGTGLFPLVSDMIADTIDHIGKHKDLLVNIKRSGSKPWYREDDSSREEWRELQEKMVEGPRFRPVNDYKPGKTWVKPKSQSEMEKWRNGEMEEGEAYPRPVCK